MKKNYRYRVPDVEHPGDYEPFASVIRGAGGEITRIDWSEEDDEAIIYFIANTKDIHEIEYQLYKQL